MSYVAGDQTYANTSVIYGPIQQGDWREPIPGWGMNPLWAGPAKVGVGSVEQTVDRSTLIDLLLFTSGLAVGGAIVFGTMQLGKKRYASNGRRSRR